jgi:hypothetical protein
LLGQGRFGAFEPTRLVDIELHATGTLYGFVAL